MLSEERVGKGFFVSERCNWVSQQWLDRGQSLEQRVLQDEVAQLMRKIGDQILFFTSL